MITEDYVSFEVAKLLKEKRFNEPCYTYWHEDKNEIIVSHSMYPIKNITNPCFFGPAAPTLQMVMKWLREVHKLSVIPRYDEVEDEKEHLHYTWFFDILSMNPYKTLAEPIQGYSTYEEACEAAIKYCLENLI